MDRQGIMMELDSIEAEIESNAEEWGQLPQVAETLRAYYRTAVPAERAAP